MFSLFNKKSFSGLLAALSLATVNFSLAAQDWSYNYEPYAYDNCCCHSSCNRFYLGVFGGGLFPANSTHLTQSGVALFTEAEGGPLAVDARGHSNKKSSGFGGLQLGYEWNRCPLWGCITPAIELEAFFFKNTKKGLLDNPLDTDRLPEHHFRDTFPMHANVYLLNGVLSLNRSCWGLTPYLGGGVGVAKVTIKDASSIQVAPPEAGVNHFNANRSDSTWTIAAQLKAGLRYNICNRFHLFGEYRLAYLDTSRFIMGSTVYPTHAHTTTWNVDLKGTFYNAFAFGIQIDLN